MEDIADVPLNKTNGFIKHVFNFDNDTKRELLNIIQYSLIVIIPIVMLNKTIRKYIPDTDESKGSLEITAEVIGQIVILFFGIYLIHRIVTYIPTYSGVEYKEFNMFNMILGFLVIVLSLQTKLGEKVDILSHRALEMFGIVESEETDIEEKVTVNVSHPIEVSGANPMSQHGLPQMHQPSRADIQTKLDINDSIRNEVMTGHAQQHAPQQMNNSVRTTDFNAMFQEPMAANESFGNYSAF